MPGCAGLLTAIPIILCPPDKSNCAGARQARPSWQAGKDWAIMDQSTLLGTTCLEGEA